jgi:hypothetical protein
LILLTTHAIAILGKTIDQAPRREGLVKIVISLVY